MRGFKFTGRKIPAAVGAVLAAALILFRGRPTRPWVELPASPAGAFAAERQETTAPEPPGWFAGDAHVHRGIGCSREKEKEMLTPRELLDAMQPQDLAVISVLGDMGNGEIKFAEKDFAFTHGRDHPASTAGRILHWDAEWHFDPRGVTFDRKAIGGHLIVLGLRHDETIFHEYTFPIFDWARRQGAIAGFAHAQYLPHDIPQELDCCAPLELPIETALGSSAFLMEDVDGSDTAIHAYYRLLNCGFRPGLAAATDYPCNSLEPLGTLLTYVNDRGGPLTYRRWIQGLAAGRTVVSRHGHDEFLDLTVKGTAAPGDEIRLASRGTVRVKVQWTARKNLTGRIELIRDGVVVATREGAAGPGAPLALETGVDFSRSGWLAARRTSERGHETQTGAVFVLVSRAPIRASAEDARFFVRWIDNLICQTSPGGVWSEYFSREREAAQTRYRRARAIFQRIALEAERQAGR